MFLNIRKPFLLFILLAFLTLFSVTLKADNYNEAPMLNELVEQGDLPPVEERLPEDPVIVEPHNKIGEYGGTLRIGYTGFHYPFNSFLAGGQTNQLPFDWDPELTELRPNWVKKAELGEEVKTFTVHIREGVKWSDGQEVTVDDFLFSYKDVAFNEDLNPEGPPAWLEGLEFEKIDEYTIKFHFPSPRPLFENDFNTGTTGLEGGQPILAKHYMKNFHPDYVSETELEEKVKEEDLDNWWELFELKCGNENPERPTLGMWKLAERSSDTVIVERNPYYWKVDTEGNQLPYIDKVRMDIFGGADTVRVKAMAGEFDIQYAHLELSDYPAYKKNEEKGEYECQLWSQPRVNAQLIFNQSYEGDSSLVELLRSPDFKKALSYSIDRKEINELRFLGTGRPVQLSPPESSPIYKEEFAEKYAEFSPEKAKEILDEIGVVDENGDGWRQKPNGEDLSIEILATTEFGGHDKIAELIKSYWEDVGVKTRLDLVTLTRLFDLSTANEHQVNIWKVDNIIYPTYLKPGRGPMVAFANSPNYVGPSWYQWWNTNGSQGEQPSEEFLEADEIFEQVVNTTDPQERKELELKRFENFYENLWAIGLVQEVPRAAIITDRIKNVPDNISIAWGFGNNQATYQMYIDE